MMKNKVILMLALFVLLLLSLSVAGCFNSMERAAPPGQVASPDQILPPEVFMETEFAHGEVVQVELDLNPEAKYQFGYDFGGSRMAIFTVLEDSEYEQLVQSIEEAYAEELEAEDDAVPPTYLDDMGDGAVMYGTNAIFIKGDECGIIFVNTLLDVGGEPVITITPKELEDLVGIAVSRM